MLGILATILLNLALEATSYRFSPASTAATEPAN
jgi:hypothetical protein